MVLQLRSSTPHSLYDFLLGLGFFLELRQICIWSHTGSKLVLGDICLQFVLLDYFLLGLGFFLELRHIWIWRILHPELELCIFVLQLPILDFQSRFFHLQRLILTSQRLILSFQRLIPSICYH